MLSLCPLGDALQVKQVPLIAIQLNYLLPYLEPLIANSTLLASLFHLFNVLLIFRLLLEKDLFKCLFDLSLAQSIWNLNNSDFLSLSKQIRRRHNYLLLLSYPLLVLSIVVSNETREKENTAHEAEEYFDANDDYFEECESPSE